MKEGMLTLRQSGLVKVAEGRDHVGRSCAGDHVMNLPDLLKATQELKAVPTCICRLVRRRKCASTATLRRLEHPDLTPDVLKSLVYSVLTDAQKKKFEETWELDLAFGLRGVGRFRCNVFNQKGAVGAVYRLIPEKIRPLEELGLPPVLAELRRSAARSRARHRPDRQRQVNDAGGDDRSDQYFQARAHPDDRGPDRISAQPQDLSRQSARVARRHADVLDGAARRPA